MLVSHKCFPAHLTFVRVLTKCRRKRAFLKLLRGCSSCWQYCKEEHNYRTTCVICPEYQMRGWFPCRRLSFRCCVLNTESHAYASWHTEEAGQTFTVHLTRRFVTQQIRQELEINRHFKQKVMCDSNWCRMLIYQLLPRFTQPLYSSLFAKTYHSTLAFRFTSLYACVHSLLILR